MRWQDAGHLYAAVVGFSIGVWVMIAYRFSVQMIRNYGFCAWRIVGALATGVGALALFSGAVATAINNPRSDVPTWRLLLYWVAVGLADAALLLLLGWYEYRYGHPLPPVDSPSHPRRRHP